MTCTTCCKAIGSQRHAGLVPVLLNKKPKSSCWVRLGAQGRQHIKADVGEEHGASHAYRDGFETYARAFKGFKQRDVIAL